MTHTYDTYRVNGRLFMVWSDFRMRATYAQDLGSLSTRTLSRNGYISNELTVRKAIARAYGMNSFRGEKV